MKEYQLEVDLPPYDLRAKGAVQIDGQIVGLVAQEHSPIESDVVAQWFGLLTCTVANALV